METINWPLTTGCTNLGGGCDSCPSLWEYRAQGKNYDITMHREMMPVPSSLSVPTNFTVCLGSDLFHEGVTDEFIRQAFSIMNQCPKHTFEVSTKRIERALSLSNHLTWTKNITFGTTVESDDKKWRINLLSQIPSYNRHISFLPLLGPIKDLELGGIHSAGVGAEEWGHHRPCFNKWIADVERQCENQGVKLTEGSHIYN